MLSASNKRTKESRGRHLKTKLGVLAESNVLWLLQLEADPIVVHSTDVGTEDADNFKPTKKEVPHMQMGPGGIIERYLWDKDEVPPQYLYDHLEVHDLGEKGQPKIQRTKDKLDGTALDMKSTLDVDSWKVIKDGDRYPSFVKIKEDVDTNGDTADDMCEDDDGEPIPGSSEIGNRCELPGINYVMAFLVTHHLEERLAAEE